MQHLQVTRDGSVVTVALNRPEVRNAFDETTIEELACVFRNVDDARAVVIRGNGPAFCAGADIRWMERTSVGDGNLEDAEAFAGMLALVNACPAPLIGIAHRAAFGGAIGLLAACDAVIASPDTMFRFSEARLGLVPAVIAPYVVAKIGLSAARYLFATARPFDAERARQLGLVHEVAEDPDKALCAMLVDVLAGGPNAHREAKQLLRALRPAPEVDTAALLARLRSSDEGREGLAAFREKRVPSWI